MIKNERRYRITTAQTDQFSQALCEFEDGVDDYLEVHLLLLEAKNDGIRSQFATVSDLPRVLIRARIARGLSRKTLAGRLGLKEQDIQTYEASEYASTSLARVRSLSEVLGEG